MKNTNDLFKKKWCGIPKSTLKGLNQLTVK